MLLFFFSIIIYSTVFSSFNKTSSFGHSVFIKESEMFHRVLYMYSETGGRRKKKVQRNAIVNSSLKSIEMYLT